ncbi:hypothetical protein EBO15_20865 [Actinomadura harenae]|uniref:Uncharacterized protein n=2 Tax=Actinomadura harenae TaxID=2483351 RepID=A0A3M2LX07_9ACTN|nr:hypothetical protein EBO15_20865 [Actinomadura harenae]
MPPDGPRDGLAGPGVIVPAAHCTGTRHDTETALAGELAGALTPFLRTLINRRPVVALCTKSTDEPHWRALLESAGAAKVLTVDLTDLTLTERLLGGRRTVTTAIEHLALQHDVARALGGHQLLASFDPGGDAVVLAPDPLEITSIGGRCSLAVKPPVAHLVEHKTLVDGLWDLMGVDRQPSLVCDVTPTLPSQIAALDQGEGVVVSCQRRGHAPTVGGEHIWWVRRGRLPATFPPLTSRDLRARVMPLLVGQPLRLHGMIVGGNVACFPVMELLSLPRPADGTFQWGGSVPARHLPTTARVHLHQVAARAGRWLAAHGYSGGFAIDGIRTDEGYWPTELTGRLTAAFEGVDSAVRVPVYAANLVARAATHAQPSSGTLIEQTTPLLAELLTALTARVLDATRADIYGAATDATSHGTHQLRWTPTGLTAEPSPATGTQNSAGTIALTRNPRGWLLHCQLHAPAPLLPDLPWGSLAPLVYHLSDQVYGTSFGQLDPPFGLPPTPRGVIGPS